MDKFTTTTRKTNDLQIMGKHGEVNHYKNIFAKMEENNKNKDDDNDFEDVDEEEEEEN